MLTLLLAAAAHAHVPVVYITTPDEDWCGLIDTVLGGDYVLLEPGDYTGPCDVVSKVSDPPGEVTIVQSLDPTQPARILHDGTAPYMLSLAGDVGLFLDLDFGEVPEGVVAVELREGNNLGVRNGRFSGTGTGVQQVAGIGIVGLRDNHFVDLDGLALDVGCGGSCSADFVEVSNNLVEGGAPRFVVHGGELELVDNMVFGTSGTLFEADVVRGEVARNALEADEPLALTGSLTVHSNVLLGTVRVDEGVVVANTVVGEITGAASQVAHNAVVGGAAGPLDVSCDASCFVDLEGRDLYPAADGPLVVPTEGLEVPTDWCGRERLGAEAVGAFGFAGEGASPGPLVAQFKSRVDCRLPEGVEPVDTGAGGGNVKLASTDAQDAGCGCVAGATGWGGHLGLATLAFLGFRRRRRVR